MTHFPWRGWSHTPANRTFGCSYERFRFCMRSPLWMHEVKCPGLQRSVYIGPDSIDILEQNIAEIPRTMVPYDQGMGRGSLYCEEEKESTAAEFTLIATGSELPLAFNVGCELEKLGKQVRVVSMPCWELFELQPAEYKMSVLGGRIGNVLVLKQPLIWVGINILAVMVLPFAWKGLALLHQPVS